ncbi:MAG: hypothetical protein WAQ24_02405, partial [Candidatus Saccharimonadales bacterium]
MTKSQEQEQDIVTSNGPPRRFFGSVKHRLLIGVCGLCVLGAIGYMAWHARTTQEPTPPTSQLIQTYEKGKASRTPEKAINDLSNVD